MNEHTPEELRTFERELAADPALLEEMLRRLPPVKQAEHVTIRCDQASVDAAICRALALAVEGVEAKLELTIS